MLTHLYDDHGAWTQRKNAANKLQHSGVATVVVYHIRHPMVHHIDMEGISTPPRGAANRENPTPTRPRARSSVGLILRNGLVFTWSKPARGTWVTRRSASL